MERLTKIIDLHNALPLSMVEIETKTNEPCVYGHAVDVLAAYEGTGLTPGQVQRLQQENSKLKCLLKFAVEDMQYFSCHNFKSAWKCEICEKFLKAGKRCENIKECNFIWYKLKECESICKDDKHWHHADEVKELIKNENELDTD